MLFFLFARVAIANAVKRFHLVAFEMLNDRSARLAHNGSHLRFPSV
jgi:hypothetical protein